MRRWFSQNTHRHERLRLGDRLALHAPQIRGLLYGWLAGVASVSLVAGLLVYFWVDRSETQQASNGPARVAEVDTVPDTDGSPATAAAKNTAESDGEAAPEPKSSRNAVSNTRPILPSLEWVGAFGFVPLPQLASKAVSRSVTANPSATPNATVRQWCNALAERVKAVEQDRCIGTGFVDSGYRSVEGRPIVVREVAADNPPSFGRVLLVGGIHGDELTSVALTFAWLEELEQDGSDYDWHVAPSMNPDGLLASSPRRINANGVDLNRNLPTTAWREESRSYWRKVGFEERRFPGDAPASEPETQWLVDEISAFRPGVIISIHAPYGVLDYDGDFPAPQNLGSLDLHRLGVYPGSLGNFASRMHGIPVITIELDHAWEMPSNEEAGEMWSDLNDWLDRYFRSVRQVQAGQDDNTG